MENKNGYIDISQSMTEDMLIYPGDPAFNIKRVSCIEKGDMANVSIINMGSHTGTHIDAPLHFLQGGADVSSLALEAMNGAVKVIDCGDADVIGVSILEDAGICKGDRVIFKTENTVKPDRVYNPGEYVSIDYKAADFLADLEVLLVGIDYLTVEPPRNMRQTGKSVHKRLLEKGIVILEGLCLSGVSAGEYELMCLPLKLTGCDGSPVRAVLKF